jgi:hypothetical protein
MFATQNNPFVTLARSLRDRPSETSSTGKHGTVDLLTYCPHADAVVIHFILALKPRTTYYYTVGAMESNGKDDGLKSEVKQFTTN